MSKAITLTENQVWSYMNCPAQFEMARRNIVPEIPVTIRSFIDQITRYFFSGLMNGTIIPTDKLKKKWDKIWKDNQDFIDNKKGIQGYASIMQLYSWAEKNRIRILDISSPYSLMFKGRNNQLIEIKGMIPFIAVNLRSVPEIIIMDYSERHTDQVRVDLNLRYTLQCFAYRKQIGRDIGIHVVNLKYGTDTFSYRNVSDYDRLKRTIADIAYSIDQELFYPREGLGCLTCNISGACRAWH